MSGLLFYFAKWNKMNEEIDFFETIAGILATD